MPHAPQPASEAARLEALHSYQLLDSAAEPYLDRLTRLAARMTGSPIATISLVDSGRQWFKSRHGIDLTETPRDIAFSAHAITAPEQPLLVPDATQDRRFADNPLVIGRLGMRAYAGIPLVNPEGHALGTLCVASREPRQFTPEMVEQLDVLAAAVMTTFELRRTVLASEALALSDPLTGLPNRPAFLFALAQAIARQRRDANPFTLLYLDLDGFTALNDRLGDPAGDSALVCAADVIRAAMRLEDTAARVGGDEFAAVLVGGNGTEAALVAERLRARLERAMRAQGWAITASIGAVTFVDPPRDETAALAIADLHMYAAKDSGRNRVVSHDHLSLLPDPVVAQVSPSLALGAFA